MSSEEAHAEVFRKFMSDNAYLLFHKDHPLNLDGANSGAEMATRSLARFLARAGKRVVVCAQLVGNEIERDGVEYWNLGETFEVKRALVRARSLGHYHLISAGRAQPIMESREEKECSSRTLICHDPSGAATGISPKILSKIVDGIICVSEAQKQLFVEAGADAAKISVVYNGVDLDLFSEGEINARDLQRILFVGALVPHKGAHLLIEAFAGIKQKFPRAKLDIFGGAALWGQSAYLNEKALAEQVPDLTFHGIADQKTIAQNLARAGVAVSPSLWFEALGMASLEAQSTGCPVIVTDVGGLRETILPGKTGILVSEPTAEGIRDALESLFSDALRHRAMCAASAQHIRAKFSWNSIASQIIRICEGYPSLGKARNYTESDDRIAVMSTWNQQCGLATYGKYLFSELPADKVIILAEDIPPAALTGCDESNVVRCWKRESSDLSRLEDAFNRSGAKLLHLNFHDHNFYPHDSLKEMLGRLRERGVKVVSHLHTTFTLDERMKKFIANLDGVIVHSLESRLQVIAQGGAPEKVWMLPHGVESTTPLTSDEKSALRVRLSIPKNEKVITSVGFVQPNKGMEGVIEAVAHLHARGIAARGYILGKVQTRIPAAVEYYKQLQILAERAGVKDRIYFIDKFLTDAEVREYLGIADLVLMNYQSQYYEASGACSIAVGSGALVATSLAPQFSVFGDAVWHMTAGFPPGLTAQVLLGSESVVRESVLKNAARYAEENSWKVVAGKLKDIYGRIAIEFRGKENGVERNINNNSQGKTMKVLFQNRSNAFTQRGGDTVVMERTIEGLKRYGVEVTVDTQGREDPSKYDLVHIFNFALPDITRAFAEGAKRAGVPFVVTTLCEDVTNFHNQSHAVATALTEYQKRGQDAGWWASHKVDINSVPRSGSFDNRWTAENAAALLTNGSRESAVIKRENPRTGKIVEVKLGCEVAGEADPSLFVNAYGVKDFVLCVGRLESRKNQLMLLKALEHSEIPVVLAAGGFSYQPDYDRAVRSFKRTGKTIILDRVSPEMLASAYKAAKIHALPSWYELPGLVSLEAARYGKNVVVTEAGTARDYFGDLAFYCEPSQESSILNAVMAAYYSPVSPKLAEIARTFTWQASADATYKTYNEIVGAKAAPASVSTQKSEAIESPRPLVGTYDMASEATEFHETLERAELAARNREFEKAHELLARAETLNPRSAKVLRTRGAVFLAQSEQRKAKDYFEKALQIDSRDTKSLSGAGMCEIMDKQFESAYGKFLRVLEQEPNQLIAIMQLVECSYALNRFTDLEGVLRRYLAANPGDLGMQYCLAGCLFKKGDLVSAEEWLQKIAQKEPTHKGIPELEKAIRDAKGASANTIKNTAQPVPPRVAAPATVIASSSENKEILELEVKISELEEAKRKKNFAKVKEGTAQILSSASGTPEHQERAQLLRAEVAVLESDLATANDIYTKILARNPRCPRGLCGKGALAAHRGEWEEAKKCFLEARTIQPNYDVALAGLGLCASIRQEREDAWGFYMEATKANPENVRALLGLIEIGYPLNRLAEVQAAIEAYLEMHPADLEFTYALAGCYYAQSMLKETIQAVDRITLFNPNHERALELRDLVRSKMSHYDVAQGAVR